MIPEDQKNTTTQWWYKTNTVDNVLCRLSELDELDNDATE